MIKSILGGKSKNLFDISKADVVIHSDMSFSSNVSYNSHFYSIHVEAGQTYTVSYDTYAIEGGGSQIALSCQTGDFYQDGVSLFIQLTPENSINNWKHITHTFTIPSGATKITFSSLKYPDYPTYFRNFQLELGSTATEYVPHELTSYKSIMKVSDGRFVTSFDERMPCKTKNLFSSSTEVGVPSSTKFDQSEKRLLEDGKWYVGFTDNNYYAVWNVIDYKILPNQVYIKTKGSGYGVAKCFYCEPSTTYVLSSKTSLVSGSKLQVGVGYYQEDGTWISRVDIFGGNITFNTPANCRYCTLCFVPTDAKGAAYFSDIQLVKGTTTTDYVPYGYV